MAATPEPASTVILIRPGQPSPEVLLIERHGRSEFLPNMYVFPGGRVEASDCALEARLTGLTRAQAVAALPNVSPEWAVGFFVAAIRETFEEAGILLARRRGSDSLVGGDEARRLGEHRLALQAGERSFQKLVEEEDLMLAGDRLAVHAHWITPESVKRRFDTLFFAALAPPGQLAAHDGIESTDHVWITPESALQQAQRNERRMIFPTACNLETLCGFDAPEDMLRSSHDRPVVPVLPHVEVRDGQRVLLIPEEAGYGAEPRVIESPPPRPSSPPRPG